MNIRFDYCMLSCLQFVSDMYVIDLPTYLHTPQVLVFAPTQYACMQTSNSLRKLFCESTIKSTPTLFSHKVSFHSDQNIFSNMNHKQLDNIQNVDNLEIKNLILERKVFVERLMKVDKTVSKASCESVSENSCRNSPGDRLIDGITDGICFHHAGLI